MRLIDADELLIMETVAYNKVQAKINDEANRLVNEVVHKKIQMLVSDAPTAYDVDKVVDQLEDLDTHFDNDYFSGNNKPMLIKKDAIKIVKNGGKI